MLLWKLFEAAPLQFQIRIVMSYTQIFLFIFVIIIIIRSLYALKPDSSGKNGKMW